MTIWFSKKKGVIKGYFSKSISLRFIPKHWRSINCSNNGAEKGNPNHTCYDFNIYFLGVFFSYTNWNYNSEISKNGSNPDAIQSRIPFVKRFKTGEE